ncbi:MAG TPA: DUF4422 domain-containing protein [Candidatus Gastranaerophilaceae bacterium]|nr:DUF4422 domain-containing protein [Candidatus Gastranaerophilaceae bacterium]
MKEKVKILLSYHKPSVLIKDEVLTPIHVGRSISNEASKDGAVNSEDQKWLYENLIGDDTGDNISHLNRKFCELTAIYWAWKNQDKIDNPNYIGFMHYRRHLSFNPKKNFKYSEFGWIDEDIIDSKYMLKHNLTPDKIKKIVSSNDCVIAKFEKRNPYQYYQRCIDNRHIKDYDTAIRILKEKYPELTVYADKYNSGKKSFHYNLFVMKKNIFNEYCKVLFDILFELDKQIDYENYSSMEIRAIGYIAEWITGIYLQYLIQKQKIKLLELPVILVNNTDLPKTLNPAFNNKNIPIVFSLNDSIIPHLAITIKSITKNSAPDYNYDIVILYNSVNDITDLNKNRINSLIKEYKNISIRYFDTEFLFQKYNPKTVYTFGGINVGTCTKFFIPIIFNNYDKVLCLNSDIMVFNNIVDLYNADLENNLIGASYDMSFLSNKNRLSEYCAEVLGIKSVSNYFNNRVLLFNIKKCIETDFSSECIKQAKKIVQLNNFEQNVLNIVCEDKVQYIDLEWNVQYLVNDYNKKLPVKCSEKYDKCLKIPKIINYMNEQKPWINPEIDFADIWWEYAKMTPFYEQIIYRNTQDYCNFKFNNLNMRLSNLENIHKPFFLTSWIITFKNNIHERFSNFINIFININNKYKKKIKSKIGRRI